MCYCGHLQTSHGPQRPSVFPARGGCPQRNCAQFRNPDGTQDVRLHPDFLIDNADKEQVWEFHQVCACGGAYSEHNSVYVVHSYPILLTDITVSPVPLPLNKLVHQPLLEVQALVARQVKASPTELKRPVPL